MEPKRPLVLAGTHAQYIFWCRETEHEPLRGAKYASSVDSVRGLSPSQWRVVIYGTPYERSDSDEIRNYLMAHGFEGI